MILSRRALQIFFIFYIISWNKNCKLKFFLDCSFRRKADPACGSLLVFFTAPSFSRVLLFPQLLNQHFPIQFHLERTDTFQRVLKNS